MSTDTAPQIKTRQIELKSRPDCVPTKANFQLGEDTLSSLAEGEFLVQNEGMSVDPYMRGRMNDSASYVRPCQIGKPLEGGCVGKVIESLNDDFAIGHYVLGSLGWREKWKSTGAGVSKIDPKLAAVQTFLSTLGMTGMTAWVGLTRVAQLKPGSTVFVSAASGAVGSIVCQIAKSMDCRVIGSAGRAKKIAWLREKAHVDEVFNYKETDDPSAKLGSLTPDGIDGYFDNVGGGVFVAVLNYAHIRKTQPGHESVIGRQQEIHHRSSRNKAVASEAI